VIVNGRRRVVRFVNRLRLVVLSGRVEIDGVGFRRG
jgi:hypothetical protein